MTKSQPTILAIDTALRQCSVAIVCGDGIQCQVLARDSITLDRGHAERLAPMVMGALESARMLLPQLDGITVTVGPGGFTGVRAGLAFARGAILGTNLSLTGVTTLEALAASYLFETLGNDAPSKTNELIVSVIDARRGEVYLGGYMRTPEGNVKEVIQPMAANPARANEMLNSLEVTRGVIIGSGVTTLMEHEEWQVDRFSVLSTLTDIDPIALAQSAHKKENSSVAPVYLRSPDAKPSAKSIFAGLGLGG